MSKLCCKFEISASNTVGVVVKNSATKCDRWMNTDKGKIVCPSTLCGHYGNDKKCACMLLRGHNCAIMTWINISVTFMHMLDASLNCVASFKSLHQIL